MTFLSTIFLVALPLALAPILLHLFDRRRNVTIEWGAMEFLLEAATRRTSARKLRQWLLLTLRVLAVAALVMALARPMLPGNWFGSSDRGETIFVIDNSMSTQRVSDNTTLFAKLIERATEELKSLRPGDTARVLLPSPYPVWATAGDVRIETGSRDLLVQQFAGIRPTNGSSDLLAAMFTAVQADAKQQTQKRRVVLLTDGQASDWKTKDRSGWHRLQEALTSAAIPISIEVIEVDAVTPKSTNVAVNRLRSTRLVTGIGQAFTVTAQIQNHSTVESAGCRMSWQIGTQEEHTEEVPRLPGGNTYEAVWRPAFTKPGVYSVSCQISPDDNLAADNRATVVIEAIEEIRVLVVEGASGQAELQQDSFFLQAAMGWVNGEAMDQHSVYRPVTISPDQLESVNLSGYRAVIVPNFTELSEQGVAVLKQFAFNGGGVWVALGPRADVEMFNQFMFAHGDGVSPVAIDGIVLESDPDRSLTISPSLRDHPATIGLADSERLDTSDVKVRRRFRFVPPPQDQDVSVLLSLSNGESLALEKYVGQGRVIVLGIPLTMRDWSELAKSQAYVVMVQDWLSYLTQPQSTRYNLDPGDPISVHLAESENRDAFLRTPHGDQIELTADTVADGVVFRSSRTILPGDYSLQLGLSGESLPFHVRRNPEESNLAGMSADDRQLLADTARLSRNLLNSNLRGSSHRDAIWPFLLILLIAFMSCELILAGIISRERFGTEAVSESSERFGEGGTGISVSFGQKENADSKRAAFSAVNTLEL